MLLLIIEEHLDPLAPWPEGGLHSLPTPRVAQARLGPRELNEKVNKGDE